MGYASRSGRAVTDPNHPRAFGVSDRSGMWYNHDQLQEQFYFSGPQLVRTGYLMPARELDIPNEQLRTIVLAPDPLPVLNARVENFQVEESAS